MTLVTAAIERFLARDPRAALEEALSELMHETVASAAALFLGRGDLELLGGVRVDQACLDRARAAWDEGPLRFGAGRPVTSQDWCVWPHPSTRGQLLLYLAGPNLKLSRVPDAIAAISELLEVLVKLDQGGDPAAQTTPGTQTAVDSYLRATTPDEVQRRQMMILLHESEWNIARVARALGVTRVTIYKRMERLGIERLRVRKTRLPGAVVAESPEGGTQ